MALPQSTNWKVLHEDSDIAYVLRETTWPGDYTTRKVLSVTEPECRLLILRSNGEVLLKRQPEGTGLAFDVVRLPRISLGLEFRQYWPMMDPRDKPNEDPFNPPKVGDADTDIILQHIDVAVRKLAEELALPVSSYLLTSAPNLDTGSIFYCICPNFNVGTYGNGESAEATWYDLSALQGLFLGTANTSADYRVESSDVQLAIKWVTARVHRGDPATTTQRTL